MTFNEWWDNLTTREQNSMDREGAEAAWEFGKLEAADHILKLWDKPWSAIDRLKEYVEDLK